MFSFIDQIPLEEMTPHFNSKAASVEWLIGDNNSVFTVWADTHMSKIRAAFSDISGKLKTDIEIKRVIVGACKYLRFRAVFRKPDFRSAVEAEDSLENRVLRCQSLQQELSNDSCIDAVDVSFALLYDGCWEQTVTIRQRKWDESTQLFRHALLVKSLSNFYQIDTLRQHVPDKALIENLAEVIVRCQTWFHITVEASLTHKPDGVCRKTSICFSNMKNLDMVSLTHADGDKGDFAYATLVKTLSDFHTSVTRVLGANLDVVRYTENSLMRQSQY